jgi:uncharacterized protein YuzE
MQARPPRTLQSDEPQVLGVMMKVTYDPEVDVLRILLSPEAIEESDEDKPGVILDYDKNGNLVGLEILDASQRVADPRSLEYSIAK